MQARRQRALRYGNLRPVASPPAPSSRRARPSSAPRAFGFPLLRTCVMSDAGLQIASCSALGFDMDHTLIRYKLGPLFSLIYGSAVNVRAG